MTNPSLPKTSDMPKISDLVAPAQRGGARVGTVLPNQASSSAAQRFDQVLQTVAKRSATERQEPARSERREPPSRPEPSRSEARPDRPLSTRSDRSEDADGTEPSTPPDRRDDARQIDDEAKTVERDDSNGDPSSSERSAEEESAESGAEDSAGSDAQGDGSGEEASGDSTSSDAAEIASVAAIDMANETVDVAESGSVGEAAGKSTTAVLEGGAADSDQDLEPVEEVEATANPLIVGANTQAVSPEVAKSEETETFETAEAIEAEGAQETSAEAGEVDAGVELATADADDAGSDGQSDAAASADTADGEGGTDTNTGSGNADGQGQSPADGDAVELAPQSAVGTQTAAATTGLGSAAGAVTGVGEVGATTATATGAAGQASAAGQVADGDDGDQLWHQVRRAIGSLRTNTIGEQQMTIRLRPAELGSVMVRISTGEAGTTVALVTESAAAASQLKQQRQQLISELEEGGLSDVAVDVGTSGDTEERQADEPDGDPASGDGVRGSTIGRVGQDGEPVDRFRSQRVSGSQARLVDLDL